MSSSATRTPVAVVGVSALFPGSSDAGGFWRDIVAGRDLITDVPPSHWLIEDYYDPDPAAPDKTYVRRGAFLAPVEFDPLEHGVPPSIVPATDTAQLLALIVAKQVLEDATQGRFSGLDRERVSVILGTASAQELVTEMAGRLQRPVWVKALREHGLPESDVTAICDRIAGHYVPWQESTFPGLLGNVIAGRIANRLNLGGANYITDAACASSLAAVSLAVSELSLGDSDMVIAGGVETLNDILMFVCFSKTPALSPTQDCRPFAANADGTMLGEGLGMVALRRLEDAERDGDRIYAVIRGVGASSDGRAKSVYAPVAEGQARALRRAYAAAGYSPATVELVEAHGTATKAGDVAEFDALRQVFANGERTDAQWCALGSVKSQVGHTKGAAGIAGFLKAVMAVHHKVLPPTIKVDAPNPGLGLESSPFYLSTETRPWIRGADHPRRAAVSAFGFGGSNFHATIEEYEGKAPSAYRVRTSPSELVLLSAADSASLVALCGETATEAALPGMLAYLAHRSHGGAGALAAARLAIVAKDEEDLRAKLEQAAVSIAQAPGRAFSLPTGIHYASAAQPGGVAFLFPGQGSQHTGMGADLAMAFDAARGAWDRAASIPLGGATLHDVVFPRPDFADGARARQEARLTATEWAQPAIGVASAALLAVLREIGLEPVAVAGHSFGELTALHAAGALELETFVKLARRRGELMAAASGPPGAMLAVAHPVEEIRRLVAEWASDVVAANHNSPRQLVLAGPAASIDAVAARLGENGIAARRLPVSTAFHSPLVAAATGPYREFLRDLPMQRPRLPVYSTAEAAPYPDDPDAGREWLARQIERPVRFADQVEALYAAGVRTFVEVGPGAALTHLVGECLDSRPHCAVSFDRKGQHGVTGLWNGLGRLAVEGIAMDLQRLDESVAPPADPRRRSKPALTLPISGTNYGKPYPPAGGARALPPPNPSVPREPAMTRVAAAAEVAPPDRAAHGAASDPSAAWAQAYQEVQRQTAEAHVAYQRAMAETHAAFLRSAETSLAALGALMSGQPLAVAPDAVRPAHEEAPRALAWPARPPAETPPAPRAPVLAAETTLAAPVVVEGEAAAHAPDGGAAPTSVDLEALLLAVVSEKTGYPAEMLKLDMHVESDLGIDSIKRVEIFSALQDRAPGLPTVASTDMAGLGTLGQIVAFMARGAVKGAPAISAAAATAAPASVPTAAPPPADVVIPPADRLRRHAVTEAAAPPTGFALTGLFDGGPVAVIDDGLGVAPALAMRLQAHGIEAMVTSEVPDAARGVVFLGGLREVADVSEAIAVNRGAFRAARAAASRLAAEGGVFVTVQDTGGDFGLSGRSGTRAWLAGLTGLVKTAAQEWPKASVKAIDLERAGRSPEVLAEAIAQELVGGGPELEVGLHADGARTTLRSLPAETPAGASVVDASSVLVATGGARGVTAAALIELARVARPRIALLGRTPLAAEADGFPGVEDEVGLTRVLAETASPGLARDPAGIRSEARRILANREIRATLEALRAAGTDALYLVCDVRDGAAVAEALREVRARWGAITGVIHGAGAIADKLIAEKTDAAFDSTFDTKVRGLQALLAATADDPLRLLCLFSSVSARRGNRGQSDYAMANEVLSRVAAVEGRRRPGAVVRSIDWGPWDGGMVDAALKSRLAAQGAALIALGAGGRAFVDETRSEEGQPVEVVLSAGSTLVDAPVRDIGLDVVVNAASHPYLRSHRIKDVPVVPLVLVLEWFARAAAARHPDLALTTCRELRVLRGIRLESFDNGGQLFRITCREGGAADTLALELRGPDGVLHYSATAEMGRREAASPAAPSVRTHARETPPPAAGIYGDLLFHGPDFQVIQAVDEISSEGGTAVLSGTRAAGWSGGPWATDAAALDGGLQLALLWGQRVLGKPSLPARVGTFLSHRPALAEGPIRCVLTARSHGGLKTVSDLVFTGDDGTVLAEMRDVEMYAG